MEPPEKPDEADCCNSGCHPCIFDVYEEQLKRYEKYLKNPVREKPILNCIDQLKYTTFKLVTKIEHTSDTYIFIFEYINDDKNKKTALLKCNDLCDCDYDVKNNCTITETNNLYDCKDKLKYIESVESYCSTSKTNNLGNCEGNVEASTENTKINCEEDASTENAKIISTSKTNNLSYCEGNVKASTENTKTTSTSMTNNLSNCEDNIKAGTENAKIISILKTSNLNNCEDKVKAGTESAKNDYTKMSITLNDAQHSNNIISDKMMGYISEETFGSVFDKRFESEIKSEQTASFTFTDKTVESELFSKPAEHSNNIIGDKTIELKSEQEVFDNVDKTETKSNLAADNVVESERDLLYKPGQHFLIKAYSQRDRIYFTRAYTPIPWETLKPRQFAVLIRIYEKGEMSNYLKRLKTDSVTFWRGPYGDYELSKIYPKHLLMIAQGTGIAPIYSILSELLSNEDCEALIKLFYCCRDCEDILLRENLYGFCKYWNFSYEVFASRSGLKEVKYNEVVHEKKLDFEVFEGYSKGKEGCFEVMVCGSEGFEEFVRDCVRKCGASDVYLF